MLSVELNCGAYIRKPHKIVQFRLKSWSGSPNPPPHFISIIKYEEIQETDFSFRQMF